MCGADITPPAHDTYTREAVVCNICGISDEEILFHAPEQIVRCRRCGLLYNNPRLDTESLKQIYSKEYFVVDVNECGTDYKAYADYIADEPVIMRSMLRRMQKVEKYSGCKGRVLDVGCAAGFSLLAARQLGWEAQGIEFSDFCYNYALSRGLKVHHGMLADYPCKEEHFDAITMWDYLEHSPDPLADLKICSTLLKPGGVILLSVPNIDSWSFPVFKDRWIGFKNIEHFYYFSRGTLAKLAAMSGTRMEDSFYHGKYISLSFFLSRVQYYIQFKPLLRMIEKFANLNAAKNIAFYFNPFDILNVVLRK
jgi:2-polyprenyl-3-methyl-5-hydroxy-6-metoxy-1,4-benzoquinol methylase